VYPGRCRAVLISLRALSQAIEDRIAAKRRVLNAYPDEDRRRPWLNPEACELGERGIRIVYAATGSSREPTALKLRSI
jgi:hypothetical protein